MFDLNSLPAHYLKTYGVDKIAEVTGQKPAIISMWQKRNRFPLDAVSKLLDFDPAPLGAVTPLYPKNEVGSKLVILVPLAGPPEPKMLDSLMRLYDRNEMSYERFAFNCLSVSRNALAARFLRGPCTWAWWQDGDNVVPSGDSAWYKDAAELPDLPDAFAGINSIYRALWHKKTIVSCAYVSRKKSSVPQFGGSVEVSKTKMRRGPRDELIEVPWAGMGGMLTHRSVFEDIIKTQGDEIRMAPGGVGARFGYEHAFFQSNDRETPGEDIPFCQRAAKAGHKVYVDLAIQSVHIGDRAYSYKDV